MNTRDTDAQLTAMDALTPLNMVDYARQVCGMSENVHDFKSAKLEWNQWEGKAMQRTLTITDYGKDYGFGRYVVIATSASIFEDNEHVNSNDPRDALDLVNKWIAEGVKKGDNDGRNEVA